MHEKNQNSNEKDSKIGRLEKTVQKIRAEQMKIDNLREKHRKEALMWKSKMKEVARDN